MYNLIHAEIYRCKHSRLFWISILASFLCGVVYGASIVSAGSFDDMFVAPLFVVMAAFISLTIGREYNDGTIRNKIISGKTKTAILLSRFCISIGISILMTFLFLIPCVLIAAKIFYAIRISILMWVLLGFFMLNISWAVIFTFVSSLITSKEISAAANLILIIAIMFGSYQLENLIGQPKFIEIEESSDVPMTSEEIQQVKDGTFKGSYGYDTDKNGVITYYKMVENSKEKNPNPRYIKKPYRTILQNIDNTLPYGQINLYVSCLSSYAYENVAMEEFAVIKLFPLYSLGLILVFSGIGLIFFRKRNFK